MPPNSAGQRSRNGGQWYLTFVRSFALIAVLAALACWPLAIFSGASGSIRSISAENGLLHGSSSPPSVAKLSNRQETSSENDSDESSIFSGDEWSNKSENDATDCDSSDSGCGDGEEKRSEQERGDKDKETDKQEQPDDEDDYIDYEDASGGGEEQKGVDEQQNAASNDKNEPGADQPPARDDASETGGESEQGGGTEIEFDSDKSDDSSDDAESDYEKDAEIQEELIKEIEEEVDEEIEEERKIEEEEIEEINMAHEKAKDQENEPENPVEAEEVAVEEQEQEQDGETETDSDSDDSSVDVIYPPGPPDDPHYERLKKQLDSWAYRKTHWHNDVEALPEDRSPMGHDWDNSVAICAIMRGEFMTDVREWLLYHKWLGVDKVYLMENVEEPTPEVLEQLKDFTDDGFVEYSNTGKGVYQLFWYRDCMDLHHHKHNWMAFIDMDEYIVIKDEKFTGLPDFLDEFRHFAGLVMHWTLVGPSGQKSRPDHGGMLRHYDKCVGSPAALVKTIANTYFFANIAGNPHTFEYRNDMQAVDENQTPWPWRWEPQCAELPEDAPYEEVIKCRKIPERQSRGESRTAARITVNHYLTKSEEDFKMKVERGSGGGVARKWTEFYDLQRQATKECPWAKKVADLCCPEEEYVLKVEDNKEDS